jgi:predicted DNA-binding transcriptional regulator AlpA
MSEHYLKPKETATRTGVAENTLAKWRMRGEGPPFVKLSRGKQGHVRYRESDLERWMAERVRASTSDAREVAR